MKVGVYFPGFAPTTGGGHIFEQELLNELLALSGEHSHEIVLYFDGKIQLPASSNIQTHSLGKFEYFSQIEWYTRRALYKLGLKKWGLPGEAVLQAAIKRDGIQLIWFATCLYLRVDIPYIATVWDVDYRSQPWFPELSQNGEWEKRDKMFTNFLRCATYILTPNQAGQDQLSVFYQIPARRFRQLAHPVPKIEQIPSRQAVDAVLAKYGIGPNYLYYPAQFWAHKNHVNLLKAFALLRNEYRLDLELVLSGSDKGNLSYIKSMAQRLGVSEFTHFINFIPREDLVALYTGAFALAYPSYGGPENLPPLEAFACGCPVIAANVPGSSEQLGDYALRFNPSVPQELALAVKKLHDQPQLREEMIKKGLVRAQKFTSKDYVQGVFEILDEFESIRANWA